MANDEIQPKEIVGLIPAGGQASRLAPIPCSKELFPVGFHVGNSRPKVAAHYLLEKMKVAEISKAYFVLRPGKWDIPAYFGDGSILNMHLGYLMLGIPFGVPFTLDQAYVFVRHATIAFGFPDILFSAEDGFVKLLSRQSVNVDATLGLFPATHPLSREDRIQLSDNGEIHKIILRPAKSNLPYSWAIAVWKPSFSEFLHLYVQDQKTKHAQDSELSAGHAFQAAIEAGLRVEGLIVDENPYLDIGTPEGLRVALGRAL